MGSSVVRQETFQGLTGNLTRHIWAKVKKGNSPVQVLKAEWGWLGSTCSWGRGWRRAQGWVREYTPSSRRRRRLQTQVNHISKVKPRGSLVADRMSCCVAHLSVSACSACGACSRWPWSASAACRAPPCSWRPSSSRRQGTPRCPGSPAARAEQTQLEIQGANGTTEAPQWRLTTTINCNCLYMPLQ